MNPILVQKFGQVVRVKTSTESSEKWCLCNKTSCVGLKIGSGKAKLNNEPHPTKKAESVSPKS